MFTIKKFNNISDAIYESLPLGEYRFVTEGDDYEAAIVRSADLKETQFPPELCAIARAGAGVNNIPKRLGHLLPLYRPPAVGKDSFWRLDAD